MSEALLVKMVRYPSVVLTGFRDVDLMEAVLEGSSFVGEMKATHGRGVNR
jgi:hypothetical protein